MSQSQWLEWRAAFPKSNHLPNFGISSRQVVQDGQRFQREVGMQKPGTIHLGSGRGSFDAPFFSISADEAASMDPMQRLGLEIGYEAFENDAMQARGRPSKNDIDIILVIVANFYSRNSDGKVGTKHYRSI
ncbi:PKSN polyketide synthase for alternapyrone biosynthesis protein [Colletotrichum asianum]